MKRFSWYTIDKRGFGSYIHVNAGTFVTRHDGGWQRYKPNRKGGHRHNHAINTLERKLNKSKASRKRCHKYLKNGLVTKLFKDVV